MKALVIASALVVTCFASGCASIVSGSNQSLSVEASQKGQVVAGATCRLANDKGTWFVNTPGTVTVHRSYDDLNVRCEKEKVDPGLVVAKSSTKAMMFGNIIFGGIIGGAVDAGTGAAYDYPSIIRVEMGTTTTIDVPKPQDDDAAGKSGLADANSRSPTPAMDNQPSTSADPKRAAIVPVSTSVGSAPPAVSERSIPPEAERLKKLRELHQNGLITDAEYERKKAEILKGM